MEQALTNRYLATEITILEVLLEDLERRLDPCIEDALHDEWKRFVDGEWRGDIFSPRRMRAAPALADWPEVPVNEAITPSTRASR